MILWKYFIIMLGFKYILLYNLCIFKLSAKPAGEVIIHEKSDLHRL